MSFLRSIIADARPRKYSSESNTHQKITPRLQTGGLNLGVSESNAKSPYSQDPTKHISASLPTQESASAELVADVSVVQEDIPINLDNHDGESEQLDNAQKIQSSMTIQPVVQNSQEIKITPSDIDQNPEPSNTLMESQNIQYRALGIEPTESEHTNIDGSSASDTGEQLRSSDVLETKPVKMAEYFIEHNENTEVIVSPEIEVDGEVEGVNKKQVTNKIKRVRERNHIFENSKGWNHSEDVLLKDGTANQVSEHESNSYSHPIVKKATTTSSKFKPSAVKPDNSERHSNNREALPTVPARVFQTDSTLKAFEHRHSNPSYASTEKRLEIPSVQIGQIDVIIEMPAKPTSKPASVALSTDIASRNYLRRL